MAILSETLSLTPSESVAIRSSGPELLEVEATYGPGGEAPPKHLHPSQDEHFEVLEGELRVRVGDGGERVLAKGEEVDVPRGVPHQMWNPGAETARVRWQTRPALRTESWFRAIDAVRRSGRLGKDGMPGPLAFAVFLNEYRDVFRLAVAPDIVLRAAFAALAPIGRLRGYSPTPPGRES